MTLFTSDQMKMVNRVYPIQFTEDEFRLEEQLTHDRLYKRLNSLKDIELTNSYYLIHVKYRQYFRDRSNEYLAKIYDIQHDVCEDRGIDLRKYLRQVYNRKKMTDIYFVIGCILYAIFLNKLTWLHFILLAFSCVVLLKWEKVTILIARRINRKAIHIQQYKELPIMMAITSIIILIMSLRATNSVLYLIAGYAFLLYLHYKTIMILEKSVYQDLEEDRKKWTIIGRVYSGIVLALLLYLIINPFLDFIGTRFNTGSIMYIEGIVTEAEDDFFGYKDVTINGITVKLNTKKKDVQVGDYYVIQYGKHTKAVTKAIRSDILGRFKNRDTSYDNVMNDYLEKIQQLEEEDSKKENNNNNKDE